MLILEGKPISATEFCTRFKIDIDKIKKNPVYELSKKLQKKDKANNNVIKVPARYSIPSRTYVKENGNTLELVYAENRNFRTDKNGNRYEVYSPRYTYMDAVKNSAKGDLDKAVYWYVYAGCANSPFTSGKNVDYEHVDPSSRALKRLENLNNVGKAMNLIAEMPEEEMVIFAKGMKATYKNFNPFTEGENTDMQTLKVELMSFAQVRSNDFMNAYEGALTKIKGKIINLVDKGVISIKQSHDSRQWKWAKGSKAGQPIGDHIASPSVDAKDYLLNYMQSHLGEYYDALDQITEGLSSESQALKFLADKRVKESDTSELSYEGLPTTFEEAKAYLEKNGFKKIPANAKRLYDAVNNKEVHTGNVFGWIKNMVEEDSY